MTHIGHLIKDVFERQPRNCTVQWFAEQINCHRSNIYDIFSRPTIDSGLLMRISRILNHNFFLDIAGDVDDEPEEIVNTPKSKVHKLKH
ncbi:MAG: XRE family transcriptional regulator [Muribaculaceae bacterium]|nr:XRE family transcriptional regulator [Muribaculaceae bacterium]